MKSSPGLTLGESVTQSPVSSSAGDARAHRIRIAALLVAYALAILTIRPFGNMLYGGDDWGYGWSVERLVLDGQLVASSWVAAAAVPQVLWGAAFCKIFGLSHLTMNVATLVIGAFGPVLVYWIGIELALAPKNAALVAFFAVINPLYLGFASSFMSDTYYVVLMLASLLAYARGLRRRSTRFLVLGSAVASVALLQRQIGIATPAAVVGSLFLGVLSKQRRFQQAARETLAVALLPALSAGIFRTFPDAFGGTTITQTVKLTPAAVWARLKDFGESLSNGYTTLLYIAVLLVPLVLAELPAFARCLRGIASRPARFTAGALVASGVVGWGFALSGKLNISIPGEFFHARALPLFGLPLWKALTLAGSLVFPLLAVVFVTRTKDSLLGPPGEAVSSLKGVERDDVVLAHVVIALALVFHVLLVSTFIAFFNNYFLPLVPLALLLAGTVSESSARSASRRPWLLPGAAALLAFVWSTLNMDVMFRYVEADARLAENLIETGIPSVQVFGYAGSFAQRNYATIDAAILKDPWGAFPRVRRRAKVLILAVGAPNPKGFPKLLRTETYRTLAGVRTLEVYGRARGKP